MKKLSSLLLCILMAVAFTLSVCAESAVPNVQTEVLSLQQMIEPLYINREHVTVYNTSQQDVSVSFFANTQHFYAAKQWEKIKEYAQKNNLTFVQILEDKELPSTRAYGITKSITASVMHYFTSLNGLATVGIQYVISGLYVCDRVTGVITSAYDATLVEIVSDTAEYTLTDSNITTSASVDTANNKAKFSASANIIATYSNPLWGWVEDYDMGRITQYITTD